MVIKFGTDRYGIAKVNLPDRHCVTVRATRLSNMEEKTITFSRVCIAQIPRSVLPNGVLRLLGMEVIKNMVEQKEL